MSSIQHEFIRRLSRIPSHGLGLSVDVYSPNLFDLVDALASYDVAFDYVEIFHASRPALVEVRRRLPGTLLEYHAEGLWLTQPDWGTGEAAKQEVAATASCLATLGCHWVNHECASKQMAGFSFGTYLPPLFSAESAWLTAGHAMQLQRLLTESQKFARDEEPLVLLEIPPLTYFAFGDLSATDFFRRIAEQASCGFVLDLGHVWTYYRYSGERRRRSLCSFVSDFLDQFPLERVVQIHMAGLAVHESALVQPVGSHDGQELPAWLDAHHAPIPDVLSEMLDQVLAHPRLQVLKGVALEVDTKAIPQIVDELQEARGRFGKRIREICDKPSHESVACDTSGSTSMDAGLQDAAIGRLRRQYAAYAAVISGHVTASDAPLPLYCLEPNSLDTYRGSYLPYELLHWGGDPAEMFPNACHQLARAGIELSRFVDFWFREPHLQDQPYDFFLLKVDRFVEFVRDVLPAAVIEATSEADKLREAYFAACETVFSSQVDEVTKH